jgi:hypothetical protein
MVDLSVCEIRHLISRFLLVVGLAHEPSLIPSFYTVADWTTICFNLSSRRSISQGLRLNFGGTGMQARTCPRPYRIGA